jgi:hypothetical protein
MLLELYSFYTHHDVQAGDTVSLYRDMTTNRLTICIERGPGAPPGAPSAIAPAARTLAAAAAAAAQNEAAAAHALATRTLPGMRWEQQRQAPSSSSGHRHSSSRDSADASDDDEGWDSPTYPASKVASMSRRVGRKAMQPEEAGSDQVLFVGKVVSHQTACIPSNDMACSIV